MKKIIIVLSLIVMSCGGDSQWPKADQNHYLDVCTSGYLNAGATAEQAVDFCNCTLGKLQEVYPTPNEAFVAVNKDPLPHQIIEVFAACQK